MTDDELHALITLMSLKHAGPRRLRALLAGRSAVEAFDALVARRRMPGSLDPDLASVVVPASVWESWTNEVSRKAAAVDLDAHRSEGRCILYPGHPAWPFDHDPDPPLLLFASGNVELLDDSPAVAIVGTRRCTSVGRHVGDSMGRALGHAGVAVVSGLALGVDAAAHRGAESAGGALIGVVACGLDTVYPASNRALWETVATDGLLLSEVPLGHRPTKWRFPARNRIIAALSDLVVVVESHARGGALSTVDEANERGIAVAVVPGSTRSPASDGTNALLFDGAAPVRDGNDVLEMLGVAGPRTPGPSPARSGSVRAIAGDAQDHTPRTEQLPLALDGAAALSPGEVLILDSIAGAPVHLDRLIEILGVSPFQVSQTMTEMAAKGLLEVRGHVVHAVDPPSSIPR